MSVGCGSCFNDGMFKEQEEETQKVFQIGFTTAAVENDPYYIFAKSFSDLVEEKSEGKMRIDVMGGGQLGQEGRCLPECRSEQRIWLS